MNKIILHGATNCSSSNYGDYLYAEMVHEYLIKKSVSVRFFQASDFIKKNIPYYQQSFKCKESEGVVYIPGGYFGEGHNARFRDNVIQFLRFLPLGIWAAWKHKPIAVIGVGAGPNNFKIMNWGIKTICKNAKIVTVRDQESYKALMQLCPEANVVECGDLILTGCLPSIRTNQIQSIIDFSENKKIILAHYNHDKTALHLFAESLTRFVKMNPEYKIVVASDSILENEDELFVEFEKQYQGQCFHFVYTNPAELTNLLETVDVVLTCKLHVGVVAAEKNKSVISVACHPEKTSRFYKEIGEAGRSISLFEATEAKIVELLNEYSGKPILISQSMIDAAQKSWKYLDEFLKIDEAKYGE